MPKDYSPLWNFHIFGISFLVLKDFDFGVEALETAPYAPNGDIPVVFIRLGFLEVMIENKYLYWKVLNRGKNE